MIPVKIGDRKKKKKKNRRSDGERNHTYEFGSAIPLLLFFAGGPPANKRKSKRGRQVTCAPLDGQRDVKSQASSPTITVTGAAPTPSHLLPL